MARTYRKERTKPKQKTKKDIEPVIDYEYLKEEHEDLDNDVFHDIVEESECACDYLDISHCMGCYHLDNNGNLVHPSNIQQ